MNKKASSGMCVGVSLADGMVTTTTVRDDLLAPALALFGSRAALRKKVREFASRFHGNGSGKGITAFVSGNLVLALRAAEEKAEQAKAPAANPPAKSAKPVAGLRPRGHRQAQVVSSTVEEVLAGLTAAPDLADGLLPLSRLMNEAGQALSRRTRPRVAAAALHAIGTLVEQGQASRVSDVIRFAEAVEQEVFAEHPLNGKADAVGLLLAQVAGRRPQGAKVNRAFELSLGALHLWLAGSDTLYAADQLVAVGKNEFLAPAKTVRTRGVRREQTAPRAAAVTRRKASAVSPAPAQAVAASVAPVPGSGSQAWMDEMYRQFPELRASAPGMTV